MTGGDERPALDECGGHAPGLTFAGVQDCRDVAARQFAAEENRFQHRFGAVGKGAGARFAASPRQNAVSQTVGLDESLQEVHLVEADLQKEPCERGQRFLAQVAASVDVVPARRVAVGEMALVGAFVPRQPAGDGPDAARLQALEQHGVGHQPRHAAVAVQEGVNPQQAVVRRGGAEGWRRFFRDCRIPLRSAAGSGATRRG